MHLRKRERPRTVLCLTKTSEAQPHGLTGLEGLLLARSLSHQAADCRVFGEALKQRLSPLPRLIHPKPRKMRLHLYRIGEVNPAESNGCWNIHLWGRWEN